MHGRRRALRLLGGGLMAVGGLALSACESADSQPFLRPGLRFPAFDLPGVDGSMHRLGDYAGAPLLVNFWATWCPPCRAEMPDLESVHARLSGRGLRVLGVSVDHDTNLVREFLLKSPVRFPVLLDSQRVLAEGALRIASYPVTCLVGRDGVLVDTVWGSRPWADAGHLELIARRLAL